jgi:hypothetical protein
LEQRRGLDGVSRPGAGRRGVTKGGALPIRDEQAFVIADRAIRNGFDALFVTAAGQIDDFLTAGPRGQFRETLRTCTAPDVLVIDEVDILERGRLPRPGRRSFRTKGLGLDLTRERQLTNTAARISAINSAEHPARASARPAWHKAEPRARPRVPAWPSTAQPCFRRGVAATPPTQGRAHGPAPAVPRLELHRWPASEPLLRGISKSQVDRCDNMETESILPLASIRHSR